MPTVTLAESAKLTQDKLVVGLIESIVEVDQFFEQLPFELIEGNSLLYTREATLGTVAFTGVGTTEGTIGPNAAAGDNLVERQAAKDAATFTQHNANLTTIMGDAEVNGLIQATRSDKQDQTSVQIASKAKSAGRKYQNALINGDGTDHSFEGLLSLCPAGQLADTGVNGRAYDFEMLDEVIDLVKDKDGQVDYIMAHEKVIRAHKAKLRALGGANASEVIQMPSGRKVHTWDGIPIFKNNWLPTDQVRGASTGTTTILAGTFDDGSNQHGIAGVTSVNAMGLHVVDVGEHNERDERVWRVKWYVGLALFSELGIAGVPGVIL